MEVAFVFSMIYSPVIWFQESISAFRASWKTRFLEFCQSVRIGNFNNPDHPGLDDFGDCTLVSENGSTIDLWCNSKIGYIWWSMDANCAAQPPYVAGNPYCATSLMYFRVDWFTPDGLSTWGDGRTFILGTDGYIELRKYVDIARSKDGGHVFLVNKDGEQYFNVAGKIGYPFFGEFILDCMNRTENTQSQHRALLAAELSVEAQMNATVIKS